MNQAPSLVPDGEGTLTEGILQSHSQAVGTGAVGYLWLVRVSKVFMDLRKWNNLLRGLAAGVDISQDTREALRNLKQDLITVRGAGTSPENIQEFMDAIQELETALPYIDRIQALVPDARKALGDEEFAQAMKALEIRKLSPRHAFRTATRKLEHKHETDKVNYLIRKVMDDGEYQERHIVRETKPDEKNAENQYQVTAKLIYEEIEDIHGEKEPRIRKVLEDPNDEFTRSAVTRVDVIFNREINGASGPRFGTALRHLTNFLRSIPLTSVGHAYFCSVKKGPAVSMARQFCLLVSALWSEAGSAGVEFLALPLLGGEGTTEEQVVHAANHHLREKLSVAMVELQDLQRAKTEMDPNLSEVEREALLEDIRERRAKVQAEVAEIQKNVTSCLEDMRTEQNVLQSGSARLLIEYKWENGWPVTVAELKLAKLQYPVDELRSLVAARKVKATEEEIVAFGSGLKVVKP